MQSLDLLANNLANSATAGYKQDQEFYGLFTSDDATASPEGNMATLPVIQRQWTDFSAGNLQPTGNPMDMALNGQGFFVVNGPNGSPMYTRNGNLQVLPSGELAVANGNALRTANGETIRVASGSPITILPDGTVQQSGQPLGQIQVVNFRSTAALTKTSSECFQNSDPKNAATAATATRVEQGKIEGSNVAVAESAMRLVGMMRQFEMLQKAVGVSSDMDSKSIQEVARVSA